MDAAEGRREDEGLDIKPGERERGSEAKRRHVDAGAVASMGGSVISPFLAPTVGSVFFIRSPSLKPTHSTDTRK